MSELQLRTLLRQKSCKVTPARVAVLKVLSQAARPVNVSFLKSALDRQQIDQATIYRILGILQEKGLVRQISWRQRLAYYELTTLANHHHVVCTRCGCVKDVAPCEACAATSQILRESGFADISDHSVEFFGICRPCAKLS
jgi:Fur family transcriptional regulator, peroxide stress response regulator